MARLAPPDRITQFFGLFAFSGKASSFIAPLLVGVLTTVTGEQRWGLAVVLVFLLAGLIMMPFVRGRRDDDAKPADSLQADARVASDREHQPRARTSERPDVAGWLIVIALVLAALAIMLVTS